MTVASSTSAGAYNVSTGLLARIAAIGAEPADGEELRLRKALLVTSALMMASMGIPWGAIYLYFDEPVAAAIPTGYAALSFASLAVFSRFHTFETFRTSQLLMSMLLPLLLMLALGGFINSSAVALWSLTSPLGALMFAERRQANGWFVGYAALLAIGIVFEPFARAANNLPPYVITTFFVMNFLGVSIFAFVLTGYFVGRKNLAMQLLGVEQQKSESLLLNVLPREIAAILRNETRTIADYHDKVSVMFADLTGFTKMSAKMQPDQVVDFLNDVFSHFDQLVDRYAIEKIRTIGDAYMVAAGVPAPRPDHAQVLARFALDILAYTDTLAAQGKAAKFRVGIGTGPVVAGVIGYKKFCYDVWGDTVNTASRMESLSEPGRIQLDEATYQLIEKDFECTSRGPIDVPGKGPMNTWFLVGERDAPHD